MKLPTITALMSVTAISAGGTLDVLVKAHAAGADDSYDLHLLAIGDWGVTYNPADSCCSHYHGEQNSPSYYRHRYAQENVATLLAESAELLSPKAIIGHGDNFYWQGILDDQGDRFYATFEEKYSAESLLDVPWYNVLGNHDYGGASYICGHECSSKDEMLEKLRDKFEQQKTYKSFNNDRWHLDGHYYKTTLEENGLKIDIFNVDTNFATVHGARQICCQCYGYSDGSDGVCENPTGKNCAGGDDDMFHSCMDEIQKWYVESLDGMKKDSKESDADWKIVNSHYSPHHHMTPEMWQDWYDAIKEGGVQLFLSGHTHAESIDYSGDYNIHFVTNGAGGGVQSEGIGNPPPHATSSVGVKGVWSAPGAPYGYFELSFNADEARLQFISTGSGWKTGEQAKAREVSYCYKFPQDGSAGSEC